jgi:ATP-dependent Lon protease
VGKTSLGQSIARALGRRFMRLALGGLRDEAELRGHRRTYINAMPGRLIQGLCRINSRNPVVMLDEIDKLGQGIGDPTGALLEIFDPEQNAAFVDHYFNVPVDLSHIFFIATANVISNIPEALRDRLEVIELPGYLETEKLAIARKHLLPRQKIAHGLNQKQLILKSAALRHLITHYTREPGLRNLERVLGTLCRKAARGVSEGRFTALTLSAKDLSVYLGPPPFQDTLSDNRHLPGLATGLAATPAGGQLFYIEATAMPGSGELILTGHLGDVMKESARAALSYVRTRNDLLPHLSEQIGKSDIHLHVPATSVPKDGPSAGLPMAVCLISLFTQTPVQPGLAFTGEITLTGRILGVGAIQDKLLAARRSGIRQVVLPEANRITLESISKATLRGLHLCFVHTIEEAFQIAFKRK